MQHVRWFPRRLPPGQIAPGEQRAGALIEMAGAAIGLEGEDIRCVANTGERQAAQFGNRGAHQHIHRCYGHAGPAARLGLGGRRHRFVGEKIEGRGGHPQRRCRRQQRPATATRAISACARPLPAPRIGANHRRQPPARRATSAHPTGQAPAWRRLRPPSPCAAIAEKQRAMQVGQPAFKTALINGGDALSRRGSTTAAAARRCRTNRR